MGALWRQWQELLIVLLCLFFVRSTVIDWNHVPSRSMAPTILPGDRILVNKLAFGLRLPLAPKPLFQWASPQRWDVVIFDAPNDGVLMVKRVIGLPGDTVSWRGDHLQINGVEASYQAIPESSWAPSLERDFSNSRLLIESIFSNRRTIFRHQDPLERKGSSFEAVTVPQGHYLVLGDNRDNSGDYRAFGFIPESAISGRTSQVLFSLDPNNNYLPRWRYGQTL
jgi:signal peptidase I